MSNPDPFALICLAVALLAVLWGFAAERTKDAAMEWLRIANANTAAAVEKNDALRDQIEGLGLSLDAARRENAGLAMELDEARRERDRAIRALAGAQKSYADLLKSATEGEDTILRMLDDREFMEAVKEIEDETAALDVTGDIKVVNQRYEAN